MFKDTERAKGRLVTKIIRDGKVIAERSDNLITTSGRELLAQLLGGKTTDHVTKVGVGTGGAAAALTDTVLTDAVKVDVKETRVGTGLETEDGTTFDSPNVVQFHFVFGLDDAKGMSIAEYGLFCGEAGDKLFSRVVREEPFKKMDIDKIVGFWQITF